MTANLVFSFGIFLVNCKHNFPKCIILSPFAWIFIAIVLQERGVVTLGLRRVRPMVRGFGIMNYPQRSLCMLFAASRLHSLTDRNF